MSTAPPCGQTNSCWLFMQTRRFPSLQTPALQNVRLLCRMLLRSQELWTAPSWARALFRLVHWVRWKSQRNSLRGSQTNIAYHYDLSNEFYRLFLDETLTYSCAWFHNEETLPRRNEQSSTMPASSSSSNLGNACSKLVAVGVRSLCTPQPTTVSRCMESPCLENNSNWRRSAQSPAVAHFHRTAAVVLLPSSRS